MDLLYSRYSNPMDLVCRYINQGRFGEFVSGFLESETERRNKEVERENDLKLWIAYVHSRTEETYSEWKNRVLRGDKNNASGGDVNLDDDGILSIMQDLFPDRPLLKKER